MNDAEIMRYVRDHLPEAREISRSSNAVSRLATPAGEVILKQQVLPDGGSHFWDRMQILFDSDFSRQRCAMPAIVELTGRNPHIAVPRLIGTDEGLRLSVFSCAPGASWEPDEFAPSAAIARQIGEYMGFFHVRAFDFCGLPGLEPVRDFPERLYNYIKGKAQSADKVSEAVERFLAGRRLPVSYALMMADFSANQFLFDGDHVTACVDLDAYVIGPREWELELVEATVPDMAAFRAGYERYLPYPDMSATRGLFAFVME